MDTLEKEDKTAAPDILRGLPQNSGSEISKSQDVQPVLHILEGALKVLDQAISAPNPPPEPTGDLESFPALSLLYANLLNIRKFLLALVKGDLSQDFHLKGYLAGVLKAHQANLRHLTWQTQMIAAGDFSQRVEFMGEFSEAFNSMVVQLDDHQRQLEEKQAELTRLNEELRAEIDLRKKTETELRRSEELYRQLAITDPLTGIFNRRHFYHLANLEIHRAYRYYRPLTVTIFDLDYFKQINDTHGHVVGDQVLQGVANIVSASIRNIDIFARYGGEEFILLLPEIGLQSACVVADRLRRKVASTPVPHAQDHIRITMSAGLSAFDFPDRTQTPPTRETLDQLINLADQALYEAKKSGRNRVYPSPSTHRT